MNIIQKACYQYPFCSKNTGLISAYNTMGLTIKKQNQSVFETGTVCETVVLFKHCDMCLFMKDGK